jgi:multiple sugar transport system ATP-binding protein
VATVAFEGVEKVYAGGSRALESFDLAIADGERMVVVGPSGCGKSTVLRLLAGLEEPSGGTMRIGDRIVNELSSQERNVAMVFQDYALYPHMTVRANLAFPLKMRRLSRTETEARIGRVAEMLDLGGLLDRLPKQLSGGQRQRVAMGRALVREPSVFLLDEPLSNLDARLRGQVRAEIADLQRKTGTTMLYVTHDQSEAMTLGDRVAVLQGGVLQQVATPRELYEHPVNVFVAGFVGSPPMNVFPTRVESSADGSALRIGDQRLPLPGALAAGSFPPDAKLRAGIRPEAFRVASSEGGTAPLVACVTAIEWLGHETLAHVRVGNGAEAILLVVRLTGMQPLDVGSELALAVDASDIHLFDPAGRAFPRHASDPSAR